jgi:hypothetical protein
MQFLSLQDWLISLNTMISSSTHFPPNNNFILNGWIKPHFFLHYGSLNWAPRLIAKLCYCE